MLWRFVLGCHAHCRLTSGHGDGSHDVRILQYFTGTVFGPGLIQLLYPDACSYSESDKLPRVYKWLCDNKHARKVFDAADTRLTKTKLKVRGVEKRLRLLKGKFPTLCAAVEAVQTEHPKAQMWKAREFERLVIAKDPTLITQPRLETFRWEQEMTTSERDFDLGGVDSDSDLGDVNTDFEARDVNADLELMLLMEVEAEEELNLLDDGHELSEF